MEKIRVINHCLLHLGLLPTFASMNPGPKILEQKLRKKVTMHHQVGENRELCKMDIFMPMAPNGMIRVC